MGLLHPDPHNPLPSLPIPAVCFAFHLSGEGGWREKFLIAPRGAASRPGALNQLYHPFPGLDTDSPGRHVSRAQASPHVASGSCTQDVEALSGALKA